MDWLSKTNFQLLWKESVMLDKFFEKMTGWQRFASVLALGAVFILIGRFFIQPMIESQIASKVYGKEYISLKYAERQATNNQNRWAIFQQMKVIQKWSTQELHDWPFKRPNLAREDRLKFTRAQEDIARTIVAIANDATPSEKMEYELWRARESIKALPYDLVKKDQGGWNIDNLTIWSIFSFPLLLCLPWSWFFSRTVATCFNSTKSGTDDLVFVLMTLVTFGISLYFLIGVVWWNALLLV